VFVGMRRRRIAAGFFLVFGLSRGFPGWGQNISEPESIAEKPAHPDRVQGDTGTEETGNSLRDPFSATGRLAVRKTIPAASRGGPDLRFRAGEQFDGIPKMKLKGHIQANGKVVALLEIQGGGVHIVREGDTVGLHDLGYDSVIRIREISRLHLVIESGSLGKVIIVR
jgi:Tfp pilus assembly protein PilP